MSNLADATDSLVITPVHPATIAAARSVVAREVDGDKLAQMLGLEPYWATGREGKDTRRSYPVVREPEWWVR